MTMITLKNSPRTNVTILDNVFIDRYMVRANGEFVKVYIYLIRLLFSSDAVFALEQMADTLMCTEKDIIRALRYWESEGLLIIQQDAAGQPCGIALREPGSDNVPARSRTDFSADSLAGTPAASSAEMQSAFSSAASGDSRSSFASSPLTPQSIPAETPSKVSASETRFSPERIKELKANEEVAQFLYIAEQYLGKMLSPGEMQKLLFFYDGLKLSPDLIEYLIEYSVSRGHKSIRYMERVAMAWAEEGITTVAMAKEASSRYQKDYYTILRSMGISGRNPVETETTLMNTWLNDYGFSMTIIQEACSRTVLQTGQSSFQYADKILQGWKKKDVKTIDDIRRLDAEHQKRKQEKSAAKSVPQNANAANRFNNFHQREYDFAEYEKKLLGQTPVRKQQ